MSEPVVSPQPEPAAAQDPPQDAAFADVVADALGIVHVHEAENLLHDLRLVGLAVVYADVPHGSRAEQVGWWDNWRLRLVEREEYLSERAFREPPLFRWLAPPVEGDAK